ncbi:MAG: sensor histidine kinase [Marinifilaceae bacterium]|nr:sensor histidine kinase [Marinifilaceae bacterium]
MTKDFIKYPNKRTRILYHLFFWLCSIIVWGFSLGVAAGTKLSLNTIVLIFAIHSFIALAVYINLSLLIKYLFKNKRFITYAISILSTSCLTGILITTTLAYPLNFIFIKDSIFNKMSFEVCFNFSFFTLIYIFVSSFLSLVREWFVLKQVSDKLVAAENKRLEFELNALKSQINPHFLFNTLNNIYALALDKSDKTPDVILKLSDLMRYIIYECNEKYVFLDKELNFINNFIELQKIRHNRTPIKYEILGDSANWKIAPLLIEPLIENAFKHVSINNNPFINITIKISDQGVFELNISNSCDLNEENQNNKNKGVGLENVKRRLKLIYNNNYKLEEKISINEYKIELKINLNI